MAFQFRKKINKRSDQQEASKIVVTTPDYFKELISENYTRLSDNPEVRMAVERISDMVSSMTIQLMQNSEKGDKRVINELSRVVDIQPNRYMTRKNFIAWLTRVLLLEGGGNAVVKPVFQGLTLQELTPIAPSNVSFNIGEDDYTINIGAKEYDPQTLLHFVINPDPNLPFIGSSYKVALKDLVGNLKQSYVTKKAFMSKEYMPSIVISLDTDSDIEGEEMKEDIEKRYLARKKTGAPWIIPAGMMKVEKITPLSLKDLAINEAVEIDKKTVASLLGVPPFLLGVGTYNKDEYNNFVNTKILSFAQSIQQTLNQLILDPTMYFNFNPRSLYNYSLTDLVSSGVEMVKVNSLRRNELRNWVGMPPDAEMDELLVLENYLKQNDLTKQNKLIQNNSKGGEE
ncbi:phage portal protein [Enterococcus sp. LJL90]